MAELTQTNDFMMKQEALWGFIRKFQPREWNISARQWYKQVMEYVRDYGLNGDVSVYMIDHNSLHSEVTSHREEVERIVWSIMRKFHDDLKILDIRNDGFDCSQVKNVFTKQKEFEKLASLYSNVLDVFCGNARLMEDSLGGPRDSTDQAMRFCGMGQYKKPIETIREDYNLHDVKKKILKVEDKPKPAEKKSPKKRKPKTFRDIIQYEHPDELLMRLHDLIDGKGGAIVGATLFNSFYINPYLIRRPTKAEFESEFELVGSWSAINNYMNDNNANAGELARKIVIFPS